MTSDPLNRLVHTLRTTLDSDAVTDADLLARVRTNRDPAAVEAIVRRHGPKVLAACRKVLGPAPEAEDAFQATFLVLLRNPAAVRKKTSLGAWLYGVAHRIALQARARQRPRGMPSVEAMVSPPDLPWREACVILHEELDRLPDATRLPLVLCYLDGLSRDETAAQLGRPLNSVKKSLEKGREQLRKRLARRGVTLSTGLLSAIAEPAGAEGMEVSPAVVEGVIRPSAAVAGLARAMRAGTGFRAVGVCLAATVLAVGVALGMTGDPKPQAPPTKDMPGKPAVKKVTPPEEGPKGERIAFAGRVVDPDGKPVKGAKLYLLRQQEYNAERRVDTSPKATTDAAGRFRFDVPSTDYPKNWWQSRPTLAATADGFGMGLATVSSDGATAITVQLIADLPIRGRVVSLEGKPVSGIKVRVAELKATEAGSLADWLKKAEANGLDALEEIRGSDFAYQIGGLRNPLPGLPDATTDADGRFALSGVGRERVATVAVGGRGVANARLMVLTQEGRSGSFPPTTKGVRRPAQPYYRPPLDYVAAPDQPFEGRVTDLETGQPIPGVTVEYSYEQTVTDRDGRYRLDGLASGPKTLTFRPARDLPYHVRSAAGGEKDSIRTARVDVALRRAPWVTGTVIDEQTKNPVAGATVWYKAARENSRAADYFDKDRGVDVAARTGPDGTFRLAGIPGKGWLFVRRDEPGVSAAERPVQGDTDQKEPPREVETSDQAGAGESPRMCQALAAVDVDPKSPKVYTITLDPGLTIPVRLTDPAGKPAPGAIALGVSFPYYLWSKPLESEKLEVPAFNPDRPRALFFYHPDRELGSLFHPKKGDAGPWTVPLQPTATVTGTLVHPDGKPYPNAALTLSFTYPGQRNPTWLPNHSADARFKTDAHGKFRFTKVIGDVDYHFWYPVVRGDYRASVTYPFRVKPGESKDLGTVTAKLPKE